MLVATSTRSTSSFNPRQLDRITFVLSEFAKSLEQPFGLVIYGYSHAGSRLVKTLEVHPLNDGRFSSDLDRLFPALSGRAHRLFDEAIRRGTSGIMPLDLADHCSYLITASPSDLVIFGFKGSLGWEYNHEVIEKMVQTVAEIHDGVKVPEKQQNLYTPQNKLAIA